MKMTVLNGKKMFSILSAITITIIFAAVSLAQTPGENTPGDKTSGINHRQRHQQRRIRQGVRSGELTKGETAKLEKEEKEIRQEKREAKADGVMTGEERKEIH